MRFEDIAGVQIYTRTLPRRTIKGAVVWDIDKTLVWTGDQQQRYYDKLRPLTDEAGLDWSLVELAHNLEGRLELARTTGRCIGGAENLFPMVAVAMGDNFHGDEDTLLRLTREYQRMSDAIEQCTPIDGVLSTIIGAKSSHPDVAHFACTLCPGKLAELRIFKADRRLLSSLAGYIAIAHDLPPIDGHPFPRVLEEAYAWVERSFELTALGSGRHFLRIGMPLERAKPQTDSFKALATELGVPMNRIVMLDDNPLTGMGMAHRAGAIGVHAAYGYSGQPSADWPPFDYSINSPGALLPILEKVFGPGVEQ